MLTLVTGISGFVGHSLVPELQNLGYGVRGFARSPDRVRAQPDELVIGDMVSGDGLEEALAGVEVAYYLIHAMETVDDRNDEFHARELIGAQQFTRAAQQAGVRRVIYLGGLLPSHLQQTSRHLASRLAVENTLLEASHETVAFRASIIIGARSRSFRFLVHLVERLPFLVMPSWRIYKTQPIDERDVLAFLVRGAHVPSPFTGRSWDIAGPDVVTYARLTEMIAEALMIKRPVIPTGFSATPMASTIAAAVAGEDRALVRPLMESLTTDLLPRDLDSHSQFHIRLHSLTAALEYSLGEWEKTEPLRAR